MKLYGWGSGARATFYHDVISYEDDQLVKVCDANGGRGYFAPGWTVTADKAEIPVRLKHCRTCALKGVNPLPQNKNEVGRNGEGR